MYVAMDQFSDTFNAISEMLATVRKDSNIDDETRCVLEHKIMNFTNLALDLYRKGKSDGRFQQ